MTDPPINHDLVYPRDALHRFRIYVRKGKTLTTLAAAPDMESVGCAIDTLDADQREHGETLGDLGALGVLDAVARTWIVNPFPHGDHV